MVDNFLKAFVSLFVAIDAFAALPFLVGMTKNISPYERRNLIYRSTAAALLVGLTFILGGRAIFSFLGITESDFRVAGGLLLVVFAVKDLLTTHSVQGASAPTRIGIVPIAVPLMMGPAALATVMVGTEQFGIVTTVISLIANLVIVLILFSRAGWLIKVLGEDISDTINKIFSLLLAAIGIMLVRSGIVAMLAASAGGAIAP